MILTMRKWVISSVKLKCEGSIGCLVIRTDRMLSRTYLDRWISREIRSKCCFLLDRYIWPSLSPGRKLPRQITTINVTVVKVIDNFSNFIFFYLLYNQYGYFESENFNCDHHVVLRVVHRVVHLHVHQDCIHLACTLDIHHLILM